MRSARVVSTVTRMMLGASAHATRAMRRMKKRKAHRIRTKREFTRGKLPGAIRGSRKSERNRKPKLHVALGARTQDRVQPNAYIRCGEERSEPTGACTRDGVIRSAVDVTSSNVATRSGKHCVIQDVKHLPLKLDVVAFAELKTLKQSHVQLGNARLTYAVPGTITEARLGYRKGSHIKELMS